MTIPVATILITPAHLSRLGIAMYELSYIEDMPLELS
jgi:hypothetical protein